MDVTTLIYNAFVRASQRQQKLHERWVRISFRLGSLLPQSLMSLSIQRDGELDLVLRCMEDDYSQAAELEKSSSGVFLLHYQKMLSELWVCDVYEILRLMMELQEQPPESEVATLAHDLRLVRIPLEKHQIAQDTKLTAPLRLLKWSRLSEQIFRLVKWSLCQG
jgi:hypothetical protein